MWHPPHMSWTLLDSRAPRYTGPGACGGRRRAGHRAAGAELGVQEGSRRVQGAGRFTQSTYCGTAVSSSANRHASVPSCAIPFGSRSVQGMVCVYSCVCCLGVCRVHGMLGTALDPAQRGGLGSSPAARYGRREQRVPEGDSGGRAPPRPRGAGMVGEVVKPSTATVDPPSQGLAGMVVNTLEDSPKDTRHSHSSSCAFGDSP